MVEDPDWRKPAPWCAECQAGAYRARNAMGYESISNAHDATVYERGRSHGINAERAAIVAWLRFEYERLLVLSRKRGVDAHTDGQALTAELAADAIERGDHLRDPE